MAADNRFTFYEFFAGGGMARLGLGPGWKCLFANDNSSQKAMAYRANFPPAHELVVRGVEELAVAQLPGRADLAWASFPCQDLSLAGNGAGLKGERSGTFWGFQRLINDLARQGRRPRTAVIENVCGALTSHGGKDFASIFEALAGAGYRIGALVINAVHFLPQSRPRLFIIGAANGLDIPSSLLADGPSASWHPKSVLTAHDRLPSRLKDSWIWWRLPEPPTRRQGLAELIETNPTGVKWDDPQKTRRLLRMMSPANREKVRLAQKSGRLAVGTVYKRTRRDKTGMSIQRAEVRFDDLSGCLRTPAGGSSRQIVLFVRGESIRSRLLSPREAARLMGVGDTYILPDNYNQAYHLMGDGLAVPAVSWLERRLLAPMLRRAPAAREAA